jgi:hypothetical protein
VRVDQHPSHLPTDPANSLFNLAVRDTATATERFQSPPIPMRASSRGCWNRNGLVRMSRRPAR